MVRHEAPKAYLPGFDCYQALVALGNLKNAMVCNPCKIVLRRFHLANTSTASVAARKVSPAVFCFADHSISRWTQLGISFVGTGIAGIVTHSSLMDRLVAAMFLLGYLHFKLHDYEATSPVNRNATNSHNKEIYTLTITV